ncbi:hypothetical protein ACFSJQ_21945 [Vibrio olivae]
MSIRQLKNHVFRYSCYAATAIGLFILAAIMYGLVDRGMIALSWDVLFKSLPAPGDDDGGLANAIIGSMLISGVGIVIAIPVGVLAGTWLAEYGQDSKAADTIRFEWNVDVLAIDSNRLVCIPHLSRACRPLFWLGWRYLVSHYCTADDHLNH